jgi:hypothetical protein
MDCDTLEKNHFDTVALETNPGMRTPPDTPGERAPSESTSPNLYKYCVALTSVHHFLLLDPVHFLLLDPPLFHQGPLGRHCSRSWPQKGV